MQRIIREVEPLPPSSRLSTQERARNEGSSASSNSAGDSAQLPRIEIHLRGNLSPRCVENSIGLCCGVWKKIESDDISQPWVGRRPGDVISRINRWRPGQRRAVIGFASSRDGIRGFSQHWVCSPLC